MPKVFINYRREDAMGYAGALMRELKERFDPKDLFMDIADIGGGENFPNVLYKTIRSSSIVLALIGPRWTEMTDKDGKLRLADPNDFVRKELETALNTGVRVIPILLNNAEVPTREKLPEDLQSLPDLNAMRLSDRDWDRDLDLITDEIRKAMFSIDAVSDSDGVKLPENFDPGKPHTKTLFLFGVVFLIIGLLCGSGATIVVISDAAFAARALTTEGEVVDFRKDESVFFPVIIFRTQEGKSVTFTSSTGTNPPAYKIADKVGVLYDPNFPADAKLKSAVSAWLAPIILGGFGFVFAGIGLPLIIVALFKRKKGRRKLRLLKHGKPIMTVFREALIDGSTTENGHHPYCIITEWTNPLTGLTVQFRSEKIWKDPKDLLHRRSIVVVIDPNNFENYLVDLSLLPDDFKKFPRKSKSGVFSDEFD